MPEGDAVRAIAGVVRRKLGGRELAWGRVRRGAHHVLDGHRVVDVRARGKHLILRLDRGPASIGIRTHLGLGGSWHRYAPAPRWRRPPADAAIVLESAADLLICFAPAQVEVASWEAILRGRALSRLGPDIMDEPCPAALSGARAVASGEGSAVLERLLDQRIACGIGNIAAHEALFEVGIHPATPAAGVDTSTWEALYRSAAELLHGRVAVGGAGATARPGVYGRGGQPCVRCGGAIVAVGRGLHGRRSAWCPACQPPPAVPGVDGPPTSE